MASKKKRTGRNDNFDNDLDFDVPDFGGDDPRVTSNNRKPIATGLKSAASGFGKSFTSEARLRQTLSKALPKEYDEAVSKAFEIKDGARDLYNIAGSQVTDTIRETKRSVGRIARNLDGVLPKKFADKLKNWGDTADSGGSGPNKGEIEQGTIDSAFTQIFAQSQQIAADDKKKEGARQVMQEAIDRKRHSDMTSILGSIDQSLISLQTYQEKIGTNYLKKSLELQFRTYFVQNDMLQLQSKFFQMFKEDLGAITKNTGLPDYVKKAPKEALMEHIRERTFESLSNTISKKRNQWVSSIVKKAGDKFTGVMGNIRDASGQILDAAEGASSMMGSGMGPSPLEMGGELAGGAVGGKLQNYIAKQIRAQMVKNPKAVQFGNKASQIAGGLPQWVTKQMDSGKHADKIPDWLKDILRVDGEKTNVRVNREVDLDRAAQFSDKNSRSLNIVIPELLSKIHHELYVSRTGDTAAKPLAYDYEKGKFVTNTERQTSLSKTLVSDKSVAGTKHEIDNIFREIDPNNKLDAATRAKIAESLHGANKGGTYFDKSNMHSSTVLGDHAGTGKASKLIKGYLENDTSGTKERRLSKMMGRVGSNNGDVSDVVQHLVDSGRHGELAEMGLLDLNTGRINTDAIRRLELGHALPTSAGTPTVPNAPGGGTRRTPFQSLRKQRGGISLGSANVPGGDLKQVSQMFKEAIESLGKIKGGGSVSGNGMEQLKEAITKASGKSELAEIIEILKKIEAKPAGGGIMTPEMLEQYMSSKFGGTFGKAGKVFGGAVRGAGNFLKSGFKHSFATSKSLAKGAFGLATSGGSKAFNWLAKQKDKFDLYIGNEVEPRLNKMKLEAGKYMDVSTGKIIEKFEDIKGDIKDIDTGEIVLRASELKSAILKNIETGKSVLLRLTGWGKKAIESSLESLKKNAGRLIGFGKSAYGVGWAAVKKAYDHLTDGPMDVYLKDNYETPVLLKRVMAQGLYFDKASLDPISKVSQIKGAVVDNEENVMITKEDLANGLYNSKGQEIKTGFDRVTQFVGNSIAKSIGSYKKFLGKAKDIGAKAMGWIKGLFGFDSPFTVFSQRTNDILSAIYNLLNDRMPGERSPDLEHIQRASTGGGAGSKVAEHGKKLFDKAKSLKNKITGKATDLKDEHYDNLRDKVAGKLGRGKDTVVAGLHEVVETLKARLPEAKKKLFGDSDGDGVRDGSIDDLRSKRQKAKDKISELAGKAGGKVKSGGQSAYAALAGLFKKKEKDDDDKSSGGGILDDLLGNGKAGKAEKEGAEVAKKASKWSKLMPKGKGIGATLLRGGMKGIGGIAKVGLKFGGALLGGGLLSAETLLGGLSMLGTGLGMAATAVGAILSSPITVPALLIAGAAAGGYFAYKWLTKPDPQPIEKVRLVQYGWKASDTDAYKKMKSIEQQVSGAVAFKGDKAEFDPKKLNIQEMMKIYGLTPTDQDQAKKFVDWFANRFRPIYLNHRALIKTTNSPKALEDVDSNKADFKKTYLDQCLFPGPHYNTSTSPVKDQSYLVTSQSSVEKQIAEAKAEVEKEGTKKEDDKTNAPAATSAVAAAAAKAAQQKAALEAQQKVDKTSTSGVPAKAAPVDTDKVVALNRLKASLGGANGPGGPPGPGNPVSGPAGPGGQNTKGNGTFSGGIGIKQPGNGTGGDINSIPIPKGNGNWAALKDTIIAASKMAGVDPKLSAAITAVESGFDANARPIVGGKATSSAKGLNQFLDGTWKVMMAKYASKYGIDPNTSAMDPRANALMGAEFMKENMAGLKKVVGGRDLTATDVYLAHFMGLGGARKFLSADPNANAASVFPKEAAANPWIYYKDPKTLSGPKTVSEIYGDFTKKLSKKLQATGFTDSDSGSVAGDPKKIQEDNAAIQASGQTPGAPGTVVPGKTVPSPKPTTPNIAGNPNSGPVPSTFSPKTDGPTTVPSPRPSYDPSSGSAAAAPTTSSPVSDPYYQKKSSVNTGDSLSIMKEALDTQKAQAGTLERIATLLEAQPKSIADALSTLISGAKPADAPAESNNYGKAPAPMTQPSIAYRRKLAGTI